MAFDFLFPYRRRSALRGKNLRLNPFCKGFFILRRNATRKPQKLVPVMKMAENKKGLPFTLKKILILDKFIITSNNLI